MKRHIFIIIALCVGLFFVGKYLSPLIFREKADPLFSEEIIQEGGIGEEGLHGLAGPLQVKNIIDTQLIPSINTDNPTNKNSLYKDTRLKIIRAYEEGEKDKLTTQSYLYLMSLENDQEAYKKAEKLWCNTSPTECAMAKNTVIFSGTISDSIGNPIHGARVSVVGEGVETFSDQEGKYTISLESLNPRRIRLIVEHSSFSGGSHVVVTLDPILTQADEQMFEKNFTLLAPANSVTVDTVSHQIVIGEAQVTGEGFLLENNFSRYLVPFDAIRDENKQPYKGRVLIRTYEFNQETANEFLQSDVFIEVHGFASEGLVTYGMPIIFFYSEDGKKLEVFEENPLVVWTTNRELEFLVDSLAARPDMPGFNPDEYNEETSPENVKKYIQEDEKKAYEESQKDPKKYPITHDWILENFSRLPSFWVFDQSSGIWDNVGYSLLSPNTSDSHSIKSLFWTKK